MADSAAADAGAASCPEEAWHGIFQSLARSEVARASQAFLSHGLTREAVEGAWSCNAILGDPWPKGMAGLRAFSAAGHAAYLSEGVLASLSGKPTARRHLPRSVAVPTAPSALAFSRGSQAGEGLLAISLGREVKLVGKEDMKGCGAISLALPKGCGTAGAVAFSPDGGALAAVPLAGAAAGELAAEVQFYSTDGERAKPIVAKFKEPVLAVDFLVAGDLVAAAGAELCKVSTSTGSVSELFRCEAGRIAACEACGPHEVLVVAEKVVEIWDVRKRGAARSAAAPEALTALDAGGLPSSTAALAGDARGGLHRIDWRAAGAPVCTPLWQPPPERAARSHRLMVERGCLCLIAGPTMTLLAVEPAVVELGCLDVSEQVTAVARAPGVWALAVEASGKQGAGCSVFVVDSAGDAAFRDGRREAAQAAVQRAENLKKAKEGKKEKQGKKPSSGKSAHGRNSGR